MVKLKKLKMMLQMKRLRTVERCFVKRNGDETGLFPNDINI